MKIGEKDIEFNSDLAVDAACLVTNVGIDFCVKKVLKELIKHSLPQPTKLPQKIIFKVGEYAFTAAIGTVVAEKITGIGTTIKSSIKTIKELKKENDEDGLGESQTQQQQIQEG